MKNILKKAIPIVIFTSLGLWHISAFSTTCTGSGPCVTVNGQGNSALSNEKAREHKEQWNDTRSLRNKVNNRSEKEFDKIDRAIDDEDRCNNSMNINAYWESNTRRCLDRQTGRPIF